MSSPRSYPMPVIPARVEYQEFSGLRKNTVTSESCDEKEDLFGAEPDELETSAEQEKQEPRFGRIEKGKGKATHEAPSESLNPRLPVLAVANKPLRSSPLSLSQPPVSMSTTFPSQSDSENKMPVEESKSSGKKRKRKGEEESQKLHSGPKPKKPQVKRDRFRSRTIVGFTSHADYPQLSMQVSTSGTLLQSAGPTPLPADSTPTVPAEPHPQAQPEPKIIYEYYPQLSVQASSSGTPLRSAGPTPFPADSTPTAPAELRPQAQPEPKIIYKYKVPRLEYKLSTYNSLADWNRFPRVRCPQAQPEPKVDRPKYKLSTYSSLADWNRFP